MACALSAGKPPRQRRRRRRAALSSLTPASWPPTLLRLSLRRMPILFSYAMFPVKEGNCRPTYCLLCETSAPTALGSMYATQPPRHAKMGMGMVSTRAFAKDLDGTAGSRGSLRNKHQSALRSYLSPFRHQSIYSTYIPLYFVRITLRWRVGWLELNYIPRSR
ncbi:hypothetical protein BZA05DRAFT_394392 [Tricharina praecox]|uniref:uncharacterized protein n=1 Tax=Tricharina praecox TaxID=43433 RepID=UPI0022205261|nr:uncharacterized protein BZA05DRAFT_394392 [Tricharina praecox]KAI5853696.1 hypothetical protein BZA05DRAFT_394392 [Tricharina praecox]